MFQYIFTKFHEIEFGTGTDFVDVVVDIFSGRWRGGKGGRHHHGDSEGLVRVERVRMVKDKQRYPGTDHLCGVLSLKMR